MENFIFCAVMVGHKEEKQAKNQQNFPTQLHIFSVSHQKDKRELIKENENKLLNNSF